MEKEPWIPTSRKVNLGGGGGRGSIQIIQEGNNRFLQNQQKKK